jgi:two-component system sensor histidine kinase QseC
VVEAIDTLVSRYHAALLREQQLASELAHELRTPLASLSLHARSLQGEMTPAERALSLQRIEQDALRAGQLLNQLLALARASRTELADAARPFDLAELARSVVADYAQSALDAGHELALEAPASWTFSGHPVLLDLALRNLIDNALAHTPPGTSIEVRLDAAERWLQVSDDGAQREGAGLPAAKDLPGRHGLGLGLGHRVVDKVAAVHGGRFEQVAPPAGFSTCYRISLG